MTLSYEEICNLLGLDRNKDKEAADYILNIPNHGNSLLNILRSHSGKEFFVIGMMNLLTSFLSFSALTT